MREMLLVFEGNETGEKRAADLIQQGVLEVLAQEKMNIKNFVNIAREPVPVPPVHKSGVLQIPDFMRKRRDNHTI